MSYDAVEWAITLADAGSALKVADKAVLVTICHHYNDKKGIAFPSYETIARESWVTRRTAINAVQRLISVGLINTRHHYKPTGDKSSNRFTLPIYEGNDPVDNSTATVQFEPEVVNQIHYPSEANSLGSEPNSLGVVKEMHPNKELEQVSEQVIERPQPRSKKRGRDHPSTPIEIWADYYVLAYGARPSEALMRQAERWAPATFSKEHRRLWREAFEEYREFDGGTGIRHDDKLADMICDGSYWQLSELGRMQLDIRAGQLGAVA